MKRLSDEQVSIASAGAMTDVERSSLRSGALFGRLLKAVAAMGNALSSRFRRTRTALQGIEEGFRELFENSDEGVVLVQDGLIQLVNAKFLEITGFSLAEVTDRPVSEYVLPPYRASFARRCRRAEGSGERLPVRMAARAGSVTVEIRTDFTMHNGRRAQLLAVRDISGRNVACHELSRLASFPEIDPNPIVETGPDCVVTYANPAALRLFPDLKTRGSSHPFLVGIQPLVELITHEEKRSIVHEIRIGSHWYQQEFYYVAAGDCIRIYGYDITARKHVEESLRHSEEKYRTLVETMIQGVIAQDDAGKVLSANPAALSILGVTLTQLQARTAENPWWRGVHENGRDIAEEEHPSLRAAATGAEQRNVIMGIFNPARREYRWLRVDSVPQYRQGEERSCLIYTIFNDITEQRNAERELRDSEARYRRLFESAKDGIIVLNAETGEITDVNPLLLELSQFTADELVGRRLWETGLFRDPDAGRAVFKELQTREYARYENLSFHTRDGALVEVEFVGNAYLVDEHRVIQCNVRDITERRQAERQIQYLSFHDKVTGLYNRTYFEEELRRLNTGRELPISIIMGDVNNLKLVNDAFGHREGDKLLIRIASILKASCRNEDIVARWGGDEFIILLPKTDERTAMEIAKRIRGECGASSEKPVKPAIALGISSKEKERTDIHETLKEAEDRMYRNKLIESKSGRNAIISSLLKTLRERSHETGQHTQRLRRHVMELGAAIGLSDSQMDELALLSALHDIGKIAIPDEILMKPESLTPREWKTMLKHPEVGYRIARSFDALAHIADSILAHHERWDGTGYPQGLKGDKIPLIARVLAIVDAYDVMTHGRAYSRPKSQKQAIEELVRNAGTQFDPALVRIFVEKVAVPHPAGDREPTLVAAS